MGKQLNPVVKKGNGVDGIAVSQWFWASAVPAYSVAPKKEDPPEETPSSLDQSQIDDDINQILAQNSQMNASTFLNVLKSKGYKLSKEALDARAKPKEYTKEMKVPEQSDGKPTTLKVPEDSAHEADASSSHPEATRAGVKKESVKEITFRSRFIEAAASDDGIGPTKFRVVLLQEGLGNLKDAYYYTKESLKSAISVFEGKKIFADHPSLTEEQTRPERSVKDVLGHFENCRYEETKDGTGQLVADVSVLPDKPYEWARALMRHAVQFGSKYPDKDFVGLSINAQGEAEPKEIAAFQKDYPVTESSAIKLQQAIKEGLSEIRVVNAISEAISCDLVTEAGAGGKILNILESEAKTKNKKKDATAVVEASKKKTLKEKKMDDKKVEDGAPEHKDEAQDIELIKQMLDEYVGKGDHAEETMKQAKEAYEAACAEGLPKEEAMKCAGSALKMAAIMKKKAEAAKADGKDGADQKDDGKKSDEGDDDGDEDDKKESDKKVESVVIGLKAENAALKEKLAGIEVEKYIDSKLAESKLTRENTKKFREAAGEIKNKKDFDTKFKVWITAKEATHGEVDSSLWEMPEKSSTGKSSEALNFADCVNE